MGSLHYPMSVRMVVPCLFCIMKDLEERLLIRGPVPRSLHVAGLGGAWHSGVENHLPPPGFVICSLQADVLSRKQRFPYTGEDFPLVHLSAAEKCDTLTQGLALVWSPILKMSIPINSQQEQNALPWRKGDTQPPVTLQTKDEGSLNERTPRQQSQTVSWSRTPVTL